MSVIARINRISVEVGAAGKRFIISLVHNVAATVDAEGKVLVPAKLAYETFSVPLSSEDSKRIGKQQVRNAIPALMAVDNPFQHLLQHRSTFIGTEVAFTSTPQLDADGKQKVGPNGQKYVNVRLEPSNADLTSEQAAALLADEAGVDDIPL